MSSILILRPLFNLYLSCALLKPDISKYQKENARH